MIARKAAIDCTQRPVRVAASLAENIAFGVPRQGIDMAAIERAAYATQIHAFVVGELKSDCDTAIGDFGIWLSGGQRQRIDIAQALYRYPLVSWMRRPVRLTSRPSKSRTVSCTNYPQRGNSDYFAQADIVSTVTTRGMLGT